MAGGVEYAMDRSALVLLSANWEHAMNTSEIDRRTFFEQSVAGGAAFTLSGVVVPGRAAAALQASAKDRVRVGIIGCGSVSNAYLPHLSKCPHVELVSTCDIIFERAERQARRFNIANYYPHIDKMLAGA
jgi:hypothetical protein